MELRGLDFRVMNFKASQGTLWGVGVRFGLGHAGRTLNRKTPDSKVLEPLLRDWSLDRGVGRL